MFRRALIVTVIVAGLLGLACSSGDNDDGARDDDADAGQLSREASVAGIDIRVTWLSQDDELDVELAEYPPDRFLLLEVSLDTHSGDLGSIDMAVAASLLAGGDLREPEEWIATSDDAHHRSGVLVFPRDRVAGPVALTLEVEGESVEFGWDEAPG